MTEHTQSDKKVTTKNNKDSEFNLFIRDRITQLRLKKDVSEYEMSFALGQSKGYIQNITSGHNLPLMENFNDICKYFEITPAEFFDDQLKNPTAGKQILYHLERLFGDDMDTVAYFLSLAEPEEAKALVQYLKRIKNK